MMYLLCLSALITRAHLIERLPNGPAKACYNNESNECLGAECPVEYCQEDHDSCLTQKVRIIGIDLPLVFLVIE